MDLHLPLRPWRPSCKSRRHILSEVQQPGWKPTELLVRGFLKVGSSLDDRKYIRFYGNEFPPQC